MMKPTYIYFYARALTILLSTSSIAAMSLSEDTQNFSQFKTAKMLGDEIADGSSYGGYRDIFLDEKNLKSQTFQKTAPSFQETNDDEIVAKKFQHSVLVQEDPEGKITINPLFARHQETILDMNNLSYAIAKRQGFSDEMNRWVEMLNKSSADLQAMPDSTDSFLGMSMITLCEMEEREYNQMVRGKIAECESKINMFGARVERYRTELLSKGWELRVIEGRTGYKTIGEDDRRFVEDDRGFVAYHPASNLMTVVYHGSRNEYDWETNFDGSKVKAPSVNLELPEFVEIHRGFGHAVASTHANAREAILDVVKKLGTEKRQDLKIVYSGHSQGAAVSQAAAVLAAATIGKEIFGPQFNNAESNSFQYYGLSVPRVFAGKVTKTWVEGMFGKDNMIRQNVHGDPVPVSAVKKLSNFQQDFLKTLIQPNFKKAAAQWMLHKGNMDNIPFISQWLATKLENGIDWGTNLTTDFLKNRPQFKLFLEKKIEDAVEDFVGFEGVGHLALDSVTAAHKRNLWAQTTSFLGRFASNTKDVVTGYYSKLTGQKTTAPGFWGLLKNTATDALYTFTAPLHYGSTVADEGGSFDPNVVGRDVAKLVGIGKAHQALKNIAQK